jgi:hypothetical protein
MREPLRGKRLGMGRNTLCDIGFGRKLHPVQIHLGHHAQVSNRGSQFAEIGDLQRPGATCPFTFKTYGLPLTTANTNTVRTSKTHTLKYLTGPAPTCLISVSSGRRPSSILNTCAMLDKGRTRLPKPLDVLQSWMRNVTHMCLISTCT